MQFTTKSMVSSSEKAKITRKHNAFKNKAKRILTGMFAIGAVSVFSLGLIIGYLNAVSAIELEMLRTVHAQLKSLDTQESDVIKVVESSIQEYVFNELVREVGLSEAIYAIGFIGGCENRAWNPDLVIREPNGTQSFGIWMINDIHQDISNHDKLDYKKATEWSINKGIKDGSWLAWSCAK